MPLKLHCLLRPACFAKYVLGHCGLAGQLSLQSRVGCFDLPPSMKSNGHLQKIQKKLDMKLVQVCSQVLNTSYLQRLSCELLEHKLARSDVVLCTFWYFSSCVAAFVHSRSRVSTHSNRDFKLWC